MGRLTAMVVSELPETLTAGVFAWDPFRETANSLTFIDLPVLPA
jgi:hypothetical protein